MAVVMPLLLLLVFGIIEFSWAMSIQQSLTNAAREGCRTAVIKGTSEQDIRDRVDSYLSNVGIEGYTVSITRSTVADPTESVTVTLPYAYISLIPGFFEVLESKTLCASCSMRKEGT